MFKRAQNIKCKCSYCSWVEAYSKERYEYVFLSTRCTSVAYFQANARYLKYWLCAKIEFGSNELWINEWELFVHILKWNVHDKLERYRCNHRHINHIFNIHFFSRLLCFFCISVNVMCTIFRKCIIEIWTVIELYIFLKKHCIIYKCVFLCHSIVKKKKENILRKKLYKTNIDPLHKTSQESSFFSI